MAVISEDVICINILLKLRLRELNDDRLNSLLANFNDRSLHRHLHDRSLHRHVHDRSEHGDLDDGSHLWNHDHRCFQISDFIGEWVTIKDRHILEIDWRSVKVDEIWSYDGIINY